MLHGLSEIKRLRKQHNLTQSQLAKLSGISQSLIAKVESGKTDASYTKIQKIFEVLENIGKNNELKAEDIMTARIFSIDKNAPVNDAIRKMKAHSISQLPVTEKEKIVGLVTENDIITKVAEGKSSAELIVRDVMEDAPPTISGRTPLSAVTELLRHVPLVLVSEGGKMKGLITKADVLNRIYRKGS
jgi:predicted transcriptional regulator